MQIVVLLKGLINIEHRNGSILTAERCVFPLPFGLFHLLQICCDKSRGGFIGSPLLSHFYEFVTETTPKMCEAKTFIIF